jgi:hypothetical protein
MNTRRKIACLFAVSPNALQHCSDIVCNFVVSGLTRINGDRSRTVFTNDVRLSCWEAPIAESYLKTCAIQIAPESDHLRRRKVLPPR